MGAFNLVCWWRIGQLAMTESARQGSCWKARWRSRPWPEVEVSCGVAVERRWPEWPCELVGGEARVARWRERLCVLGTGGGMGWGGARRSGELVGGSGWSKNAWSSATAKGEGGFGQRPVLGKREGGCGTYLLACWGGGEASRVEGGALL